MIIAGGEGEARAYALSEEDMLALGRLMAGALQGSLTAQKLLLHGPLGAGKTTLTRGLVDALPGGGKARVSSPSFNIVNYYPTRPECAHFDLYRLEGAAADESLMEAFEADDMLVIVEWAQYLDQSFMPEDRLDLEWIRSTGEREIILKPTGPEAERYLNQIIAPGARGGSGN